jgi:hypothetical protein
MNDELSERRRRKAVERVDDDCERTIELLRQAVDVDRVARQIAASVRAHPSNGRVFDWEDDK